MNSARILVAGAGSHYRKIVLAGTALTAVALLPSVAQAQSVWGGGGSSTITTDYNLGTNWSTNPTPPTAAGSSAQFDASGSSTVTVTAGPITPDSWTFNAASQSFTISGAAVNFGNAATLTNNASAGQTISISNNMSGTTLSQTAASTLTLTGTNSFTNTNISAGTLALSGAGSVGGNSLVTVGTGAATATFDISATSAGASIQGLAGASDGVVTLGNQTLTSTNGSGANNFFGAINGNGGLTVSGGQQILGGANTYTGVTTVNSGAILGILGGGTIANSSKLVINGNGDVDISVTISGTSIKSLASTSSSALVLLGNMTLTITAANDTYAGGINGGGGNGGLTLTGGTETLTGSNGYSGATTINGGTLVVNSSIASSSGTTVNSGGTLAGTGNVGNTAIAGGTLAPGSGTPGSSLTVNGVLGFTAASTYAVNINPATSSFAHVTGTATLGGATVNAIYASGSYVARQYTILTAGMVSGAFGSLVNTNLPGGFAASLSYDNKDAFLNLALSFTAPGSNPGLNTNQQHVGNALTNFFNSNGGIPLVYGALTPAGLSQASGETATGSQQTTFNAMTQFMGVMTDPFIGDRGNGLTAPGGAGNGYASTQTTGAARDAYAMFDKAPVTAFEQRWSTWLAGYGGSQTTDGNATLGSNTATSSIAGTAVGADYRFSPDTIAGFSLAGGGTSFSVANAGSGRSDLFQAGAFVRHTAGPAYISAALAYGWQDVTTDRTVTVAGTDMLHAEFNANAFSGRVEGGYRYVTPWMGVTPYAAGQFTTFDLPAYAENIVSGGSAFALAYGARSVTDARSELGLRTDKSWAMTDSILTLRSRFAWAHDYDPDRSVAATFQALPGASFVVNGAAQAHDSALTTASAEIKWLNGFSVAATFEGEFSDVTSSYAGKGVLRYAW
jgi:autotransporter-associated beta strand protein